MPEQAAREVAAWTAALPAAPGREPMVELHAKEMNWDQRLAACEMLAARGDVRAAVVVTSNPLLRSAEAVEGHRQRQLKLAEESAKRSRERREAAGETEPSPGEVRGRAVCDLLAGRRRGGTLTDAEYVQAAMVPMAAIGAAQRAFCFFCRRRVAPGDERAGAANVFA